MRDAAGTFPAAAARGRRDAAAHCFLQSQAEQFDGNNSRLVIPDLEGNTMYTTLPDPCFTSRTARRAHTNDNEAIRCRNIAGLRVLLAEIAAPSGARNDLKTIPDDLSRALARWTAPRPARMGR